MLTTTRCLACRKDGADWEETATPSHRFCGETCQKDYYASLPLQGKTGQKKKTVITKKGADTTRIKKPMPISALDQMEEVAQAILAKYPNCTTYPSEFTDVLALGTDELTRGAIRNFVFHTLTHIPSLPGFNTAKSMSDEDLALLPALTELNLAYNERVTGLSFARLPWLVDLSLAYNDTVSNTHLRGVTQLRRLTLVDNSRIVDSGIETLVNLRWLNLSESNLITGEALPRLVSLRSLALVNNTQIEDSVLRQLTGLSELWLEGNEVITNYGVRPLVLLERLHLTNNQNIDEDGLWQAIYMKTLEYNPNGIFSRMSAEKHLRLLQHWKDAMEIRCKAYMRGDGDDDDTM